MLFTLCVSRAEAWYYASVSAVQPAVLRPEVMSRIFNAGITPEDEFEPVHTRPN